MNFSLFSESVLLFLFLTLLGNTNQRRAIFSSLKNQNATIFNLQETFFKQGNKKIWSAEWGGKILFSQGSNILKESVC